MISFQFKFKHNAPIVDCYICYCEWKEAFIHCAKASGPNLISFGVACSSLRWLPILVNWAAVTSPNPAPHLKGARDVYLGKSQLITNGAVTEHHHQVYSGWMGGNRCEFSIHSSFGQSEMNTQCIMLLFSEMIVITCFYFSLATNSSTLLQTVCRMIIVRYDAVIDCGSLCSLASLRSGLSSSCLPSLRRFDRQPLVPISSVWTFALGELRSSLHNSGSARLHNFIKIAITRNMNMSHLMGIRRSALVRPDQSIIII